MSVNFQNLVKEFNNIIASEKRLVDSNNISILITKCCEELSMRNANIRHIHLINTTELVTRKTISVILQVHYNMKKTLSEKGLISIMLTHFKEYQKGNFDALSAPSEMYEYPASTELKNDKRLANYVLNVMEGFVLSEEYFEETNNLNYGED